MSDVLFLYNNTKKIPNEIRVCDCFFFVFFDYGLQLIKSEKYVDELFFAVEYLIITKLIIAEKVIAFDSDIFILCCDRVFLLV